MKSFGLLSFGVLFVTSLSGVLAIPQEYSTNPGSVNATQPAPQPLPQPEDILTLASDLLGKSCCHYSGMTSDDEQCLTTTSHSACWRSA